MTTNYGNGKVYKLISDATDFVYVGSTTQNLLAKRLYEHKKCAKNEKVKTKVYQVMREVGIESFRIILVKDFPCERKEQLTAEEENCRKQINSERLLNTRKCYANVPYGLPAEEYNAIYYTENAEQVKAKQVQYRSEHVDEIKAYRTEHVDEIKARNALYYAEHVDKIKEANAKYRSENVNNIKEYRLNNNEKFKEANDKYRSNNSEKIKENRSQKIQCDCGSVVVKNQKSRHEKSQKHMKYIKDKTE